VIAFRTNAGQNVGIGHLARCYRLALELFHRGYECHFYLDGKSEFLSKYLHPFSYSGLYESGAEFLDEKSDSMIFKNSLKCN
jgi:spore coat polysaccharide biosynthesis predicted glycosyltransferase SpsG